MFLVPYFAAKIQNKFYDGYKQRLSGSNCRADWTRRRHAILQRIFQLLKTAGPNRFGVMFDIIAVSRGINGDKSSQLGIFFEPGGRHLEWSASTDQTW